VISSADETLLTG